MYYQLASRCERARLDDRRVGCVAKHRAPLRDKSVAASFHLFHRRTVEFIADSEIKRTFYNGDIFINRVSVRWDDAAGEFPDPDNKWLADLLRVAVEHLD